MNPYHFAVAFLALCCVGADDADAATEPFIVDQLPAESSIAQAATSQPTSMAGTATDEASAVAGWGDVLETFVTDDGGFRYAALRANDVATAKLDAYLGYVAGIDTDALSRDARLALLINAYNAYTVKSVLELWPVESVLSEDGFFDGRTHLVAGAAMTLNQLENDHIRARFEEPRIHFLVNCASTGCPPLADVPVTADNLETLLESHARSYVRASFSRGEGSFSTSQIFDWFAGDFEASGGVREFIARYLDADDAEFVRDPANEMRHTEYDWSLNGRD